MSAQLVDRSLPTPEIRSSNPVIGKIYMYYQLYWKDENKLKKSPGMPKFKKRNLNQAEYQCWMTSNGNKINDKILSPTFCDRKEKAAVVIIVSAANTWWHPIFSEIIKNWQLGGSPGLVVMGRDSRTEGRGSNPGTVWTFLHT